MRMPRCLSLAYGLLLFSVVALDQSSKLHAQKAFLTFFDPQKVQEWTSGGHTLMRLGSLDGSWATLEFTYVRNTGAIWGILQNLPRGLSNLFFLTVYPLFVFVLASTFRATHPGQRLVRMALILIVAGAVGNYLDRLTVGYVIDWVHVQWRLLGWEYSYPVFNVADMAIVSGVVLWFVDGLWETRSIKKLRS